MAESTPHLGDAPEVKTFTGLLSSYTESTKVKFSKPVKINKSFKVLIYSLVPFVCMFLDLAIIIYKIQVDYSPVLGFMTQ